MSEATYRELSAVPGAIKDTELNIVDDNDTNRTVIASYDMVCAKLDRQTIEESLSSAFRTKDGEPVPENDIKIAKLVTALSALYESSARRKP